MRSTPCRHRPLAGLAALAAIAITAPGCETISRLAGGVDRPTARVSGARLRDIRLDSITLDIDVVATNPYPVALPVLGLSYELRSAGAPFLSGSTPSQQPVPARGSSTLTVPATVSLAQLLGAVASIKPGAVVPYEASIRLAVDAPGAGRIELPLNRSGELPVPAPPEVELTSVSWEQLSIDDASALLKLRIVNKNDFAVDLVGMSYRFALGGSPIAASSLEQGAALAPGGAGMLDLRARFVPRNLGLAAFRMLAGSEASYALDGVLSLASRFGRLDLPFARKGTAPIRI